MTPAETRNGEAYRVRSAAFVAGERLRAGTLWEDYGLVFTTHTGAALSERNVLRDLQCILKKTGMRRSTVHSVRHGCASLLAASGASLKEAQEILGHSSYQLTANLCTHVFEKAKRDAMDRMDAFIITLKDVMVTSYQTGGSNGATPTTSTA